MDKTLIEMIEKLGLTNLESEVYIATLLSKKGTAYDISRSLKTRTSVYTTLEKLRKHGLVTLSVDKSKKLYHAKNIQALVEEKAEENAIIFKNILTLSSHLLSIKHTGIKIFKGESDLKEALMYGISRHADSSKQIYALYPSSSKMTISPKDTIYYNTNVTLHSYGYTKHILSDTNVRKEYLHLDQELGFSRTHIDSPILRDLSRLAIGVEVIEDSNIIKIIFYKETLILAIENVELARFIIAHMKTLLLENV